MTHPTPALNPYLGPIETTIDAYDATLVSHVGPPEWRNPTPSGRYNLLVIGGGSAGLVAAAGGAGLGAKVALVEKSLLGGDCLNTGCVPSKTVIRSAKVMGEIRRAGQFGIRVPEGVTVDFGGVMQRMRRVKAEISVHDSAQRFKNEGIDVFLGEGHFIGPDAFEVGGQTIRFKKAVIATGSRAARPAIPGLAEAGYLTNESVFRLTTQPKRLAVIGGGPIGCELAQTFQRLGSQVTLMEINGQILTREDQDAAAIVQQALEADGISIQLGVKIQEVAGSEGGKLIRYEQDGAQHELRVDEILVGAGRVPNIEGLGLDAAGVAYDKRGITVNDAMQTTTPQIFAAGDVGQKYQFTHVADATARIALQNALFPGPRKKASKLIVPWVTYTDPEIAHVGLYEYEAVEQGIPVQTFVQRFDRVDRALTDGDEQGFVKVHVRKGTDKILGATMVAAHAGESISEITTAMVGGLGLGTLATVIHPYPTEAEAIKKAADAYNRTRFTPLVAKLFKWWLGMTR